MYTCDTPCNVMFLFLQPITDNDASKFLLFFATDQCFKNSIIEYISQRSRLVRQMALLYIYKDRVSSKKSSLQLTASSALTRISFDAIVS